MGLERRALVMCGLLHQLADGAVAVELLVPATSGPRRPRAVAPAFFPAWAEPVALVAQDSTFLLGSAALATLRHRRSVQCRTAGDLAEAVVPALRAAARRN